MDTAPNERSYMNSATARNWPFDRQELPTDFVTSCASIAFYAEIILLVILHTETPIDITAKYQPDAREAPVQTVRDLRTVNENHETNTVVHSPSRSRC